MNELNDFDENDGEGDSPMKSEQKLLKKEEEPKEKFFNW